MIVGRSRDSGVSHVHDSGGGHMTVEWSHDSGVGHVTVGVVT